MKDKITFKGYCFFIYNEEAVDFKIKDYLVFAGKALIYSIKGILGLNKQYYYSLYAHVLSQ